MPVSKSETPAVTAPHTRPSDEILRELGGDRTRGLTEAVVQERIQQFGPNELQEEPPVPWWIKLLSQFNELVIWILIVAAVISGVSGDWVDTWAIMAIVLLNGILGFVQEGRAERALQALQKMSAPLAKVLRNGSLQGIPARELVPGDVVSLEAGDQVPADARLLTAFSLKVQEAALTGESVPVDKEAATVLPAEAPLGDRRNMVYMSTTISAGKAEAVITSTGMQTELGNIAGLLQRQEAERTPLQRRLAELGKVLVAVCLAIVGLIFVLEVWREGGVTQLWGSKLLAEIFLRSVSLAVAAVPEGLPAVVTVALALGLQRMVARHVLIRRLPSVETLGCVTVICSDKTGTLTRNEMTVRKVLAGGHQYDVTGSGYAPTGEFLETTSYATPRPTDPATAPGQPAHARNSNSNNSSSTSTTSTSTTSSSTASSSNGDDDRPRAAPAETLPEDLRQVLTVGLLCNNAQLLAPDAAADRHNWQIVGDPTEGALVVAAEKAGLHDLLRQHTKLREVPFDSDRKMMSVITRQGTHPPMLSCKGAPEVILARCQFEQVAGQAVPLTDARRARILEENTQLAGQALRVLALAYRLLSDDDLSPPPAPTGGSSGSQGGRTDDTDTLESQLVLSGLVGMIDPPRDEVRVAISKCRTAGIQPVMITGDHPDTAAAIGRELQMLDEKSLTVTGKDLQQWSDDKLSEVVEDIAVYARVTAEHKLRVVKAWQNRGHIVAMTGDGVNDAPAVKQAEIGIAMGITGTDVTKAASDMVLTDDNFASIVNAVEEGRGIFDNIQKFVHYLLSCNVGEVLLMLLAAIVGWPPPLMAIQLLWINLVTDGLPALALGMEPTEKDVMQRPPRPAKEPVITPWRGWQMIWHGMLIASAAGLGYWWVHDSDPNHLDHARTVAFNVMAFSQLFFSLACRSNKHTMPQLGWFSNPLLWGAIAISGLLQLSVTTWPLLQKPFKVVPLELSDWGFILLLSMIPATVIELIKLITVKPQPVVSQS